jgi:Ribonuclease G/E
VTPEQAREMAKQTQSAMRACHRCHGTGVVRKKMWATYETDSVDEIENAHVTVECPECIKRLETALLDVDRKARQECAEIAESAVGLRAHVEGARAVAAAIRATIAGEGQNA